MDAVYVLCIVSQIIRKESLIWYKLGIAEANAMATLFACVRNFYGKKYEEVHYSMMSARYLNSDTFYMEYFIEY